jgi:tetratricopeptide (TPR) repeat protein
MVFSGNFISAQTDNSYNAYLDETNPKYDRLLYCLDVVIIEDSYSTGKIYLTEALEFYNNNQYEESIDSFLYSLYYGTSGLVYYYIGICLMDIGNYELAKGSFKMAIYYFFEFTYERYSYDIVGIRDYKYDDLYSYDNNGIKREHYFSYYNIACIDSLQKNADSAYEYLCEALFHGYPYIDNIKNDNDLYNLFSESGRLHDIEAVYNAGSDNTVIGTRFSLETVGYSKSIYFIDNNKLEQSVYHQNGFDETIAEYVIRNYIIFSDIFDDYYDREEGFIYIKRFEGKDGYGRKVIILSRQTLGVPVEPPPIEYPVFVFPEEINKSEVVAEEPQEVKSLKNGKFGFIILLTVCVAVLAVIIVFLSLKKQKNIIK